MIVNIRMDLEDGERNALANLFDGKVTKRMVTRAEVIDFVDECVDRALQLEVGDTAAGAKAVADVVIPDINRGGWSFIGQEESKS